MLSLDLLRDTATQIISFLTEISTLSNYIKGKFVLCHFLIDCCYKCGIMNIELHGSSGFCNVI